ncbi:MAG: Endoglucanase, aminopeptidase family [Anaerocolumna sp.]|nr:Endoglucanase, aminopeptidase family [Anaerocolumna sp.]
MNEKLVLRELCTTDSPSGREDLIYNKIKELFNGLGEISINDMNNIYIHKSGKNKFKIMLMAHSDEVFLMVSDILSNGFLKFNAVGIDPKTLVSQEVTVHGRKKIHGIIGIKPPHLMKEEEKKQGIKVEQLLIDTGLDDENLKKQVKIGDYVTLNREFYELLNNNVTCKAIDDRAGIAAMWVCAEELKQSQHYADVYFVCSCQEEVGHRGAKMAAYDINPDIGIAIDVTFDSGEFGDKERENKLGSGPSICVGPNVHCKVREKIIEIANKHNIPYQIEVEPGNTGTDAWDIQIAREGIATLLISIPIKYMHTTVEIVNLDDIKNTGLLIAEFIKELAQDELEGLFCF